MRHRDLASMAVLALAFAVALLSEAVVAGQARPTPQGAPKAGWTPPRTPDGQPDLQGVWANNSATPLERPAELAGKERLTEEEVATLKQRAARIFNGEGDAAFGDNLYKAALADVKSFKSVDGETGDYNHFWLVERDFDNRTSLVTDPPDGKLPPLTPAGKQRQDAQAEARNRPAAGPEDRSLSERCITFGVPRVGAGYNSYYQIFQSSGYVVIGMETIHDARVIPLDGRPHLPQGVHQWLGDSRGHWEGNTLVVDTTNFSPKSFFLGSGENLHLTERFTRVGPGTLNYEITVNDATTWTKPWTALIRLQQSQDAIYEYACHEGNTGLEGILAGARADEKAAAKKGSR